MPTRMRQIIGNWGGAAMVRGEDRHGHFTHTPRPTRGFDPNVLLFHEKAANAVCDVLFNDAKKVRQAL